MKIRKTVTCLFGHGFDRYTKTCDMDRGIKVFNQASRPITSGYENPDLNQTKKHVPHHRIGRAK